MQMTGHVPKGVRRHEAKLGNSMDRAGDRAGRPESSYSPAASGIAWIVSEDMVSYPAYESEGSERRSLGSIPVTPVARWTATLTVPIPPRDVAFLEVEREGELPEGYRGAEERALLSVPVAEAGALIELLTGIVAQARRDGVLPAD
jgi:hypothetical protein